MSRRARPARTGVSSQNGPANSTAVEPTRYAVIAVCGVLLLLVAGVFGQTARHEFVNYDDDQYVIENTQVAGGLTADGLAWALTRSHASNWHPLTWVSHMADCEMYGLGHPGGHHLTSVLLHAATAILLFLVLLEMTTDLWPSAFVAALFAVHPLHVESVAWVSERKDVLSGMFFVLTLGAYARYVRRPSVHRYLVVLGAFSLGLLSKPMVVTLPLVLLLLDYWPLRRITTDGSGKDARFRTERTSRVRWLVLEKIPLLVLGLATAAVTYLVQGTARQSMPELTLQARVTNALVSYVDYLGKFVYPVRLAVFYPHPGTALPMWQVLTASVVLCGISASVFAWGRRRPYLLVGWLWYLGMLVPVIGIVQVGYQAMADRYTYLPHIGIYMMVAWGAVAIAGTSPSRRHACAVGACVVVALLSASAWRQTSYWRDSEALWTHALASTSRNYEAHHHLAKALAARGESDAAIAQYRQALEIRPDFVEAHNNLGNVLAAHAQVDAAVGHYETALHIKPDYVEAHNNLGLALAERGETAAAMAHYRRALAIDGEFVEAHYNLANALAGQRQVAEAITHYEYAVRLRPNFAAAHNNLGTLLAQRGDVEAAIAHYQKALEIDPQFVGARRNLAAVTAGRKGS